MEDQFYDVFVNAKNIINTGNYQKGIEELSSTEINEEDIVQIIRYKFYTFLIYIEDDRQEELNDLLAELKEAKDQQKLYYNIFRFYTVFVLKKQYKEEVLNKMIQDIMQIPNPGSILQPAIYILSLILLEIDDRERFLKLTSKISGVDSEVASLVVLYYIKLNRLEDAEKVLSGIKDKDSDSTCISILEIIILFLKGNNDKDTFNYSNVETAFTMISSIKSNYQMTPKLFNLLGISLMFKGNFKDAVKPLNLAIDNCQKNSVCSRELPSLYVNLICCYRNLGYDNDIHDCEEKLRNIDNKNNYFDKVKNFEEEFAKVVG